MAVLREYLALDLRPVSAGGHHVELPFPLDIERLFDDFVFMCFFVGNDFLPHSPTLETREGAIDLIMTIYRQELPRLGGYLCCDGKPDLRRVERFVAAVGQHEEAIFQKRARTEQRQRARRKRDKEMGQQPCRDFKLDAARGTLADSPTRPTPGSASAGPSTPPTAHRGAPPEMLAGLQTVGRGRVPPPAPPSSKPPGTPKPTRNPT